MQTHVPKLRIGVLGAGMIATAPFGVLPNLKFMRDRVEVVSIASRRREQAQKVADAFGIPCVHADLDAMLAAGDLDAVVNLTPISTHYETSIRILEAGKHLISEKPLATTMAQADELCAAARRKGVHIIVAPVDMLAREWWQARRLVSEGAIGRPAFARVQSSHSGPAAMAWPTDPTWFYRRGAGPMLDLGAYGLQRVTGILGSAIRVSAFSGVTAPVRTVVGGIHDGLSIEVQEPDNNVLLLDFGDSVFATVDVTYNVLASRSPAMEVYGSEGVLIVHRADSVGPRLEIFRRDAVAGLSGWITPAPVWLPEGPDRIAEIQRGALVEHLVDCLDAGIEPALSGDHARHVLEIMIAARESAASGRAIELTSRFTLPPARANARSS